MSNRPLRIAGLALALILIFAALVLIGLRVLPQPHSEIDYLVVGSIATLVTLGSLFALLIATSARSTEMFFKRRKAGSTESEPPPPSGN